MKKIISMVIVVVMVMAFASTAFAAGESLTHSGTSTQGYYTDDYFDQKNDLNITCTSAYSSYPMVVAPAIYNNGWVELTNRRNFMTGHLFVLQPSPSVRRVHLHLVNTVSAATSSSGSWILW